MKKRPSQPFRNQRFQQPLNDPKTTPIPTQARQAAYAMLQAFDETGEFISRLGEQSLWARRLSPRDRLLGLRIAETTILRRSTIKTLLSKLVDREPEQIEKGLWRLLELGSTQLLFLNDIEPHAAIFETVELAGWMNQLRWKGFANGILRELQRNIIRPEDQAATTDFPGLKLPSCEILINERLAPEQTNKAAYFAFLYSLPTWLVERWLNRFTEDEFLQVCTASLNSGPICLRVNSSKISCKGLLDSWKELDINYFCPADSDIIILKQHPELTKLPGFEEGYFFVQDISATEAVRKLMPAPAEKILDMCAAPGSKTIQLADLLQGKGEVVATDVLSDRIKRVEENIKRSRFSNIKTQLIKKDGDGLQLNSYDAVLVDAPCSNTGVFGKRPEVRARIAPGDFNELARIQLGLLRKAVSCLKNGSGRIVYSTCSIEPEENKGVIKNFLKEFPEFICTESKTILPVYAENQEECHDGAYWALLERK